MDILTYIQRMIQLYGSEPAPVRYNTQQYLQGGRVGYKPGGIVEPGVMYYGSGISEYLDNNPTIKKEVIKKLKNKNIRISSIAEYISDSGYGKLSPKGFDGWISENQSYKKIKAERPKGGPQGDPSDPARQVTQKKNKWARIKTVIDQVDETGDINILKSQTRKTGGKLTLNQANILSKASTDPDVFNEAVKFLDMDRKELRSLLNKREANIVDVKAKAGFKRALALPDVELQDKMHKIVMKNASSVDDLAKALNISKAKTLDIADKLYKNIYATRVEMGKGKYSAKKITPWLPREDAAVDKLLKNLNNTKGLRYTQQENIGTLFYNAFGRKTLPNGKKNPSYNPKKYKQTLSKLSEYNRIVELLPENIKLNLDHPLSKMALKSMDVSADKLVRVTPISESLNKGLKLRFDTAYANALRSKDVTKQKAIQKLAKQLEINIGKVTAGGNIYYGVKDFRKLDIAQTIIDNLKQQNVIAENIKNLDPNLKKAAGMERYKFNIDKFSKKEINKLAKIIEQGPDGIKFLNKQAVAQTMWKAIGDKGGKICSPRIVKAEGGRIGFAEKTCGLAFATQDPAGYMAEVKNNKKALNAFKAASQSKSKMLKFARAVSRDTMNPVGWIGGELLISGGITAAMLSEGYTTRKAIDDGLAWFLPKNVLKSRLHEIEEVSKKEGVPFETVMPFFQLEVIADEHEQQKKLYEKSTNPLAAWSPQNLHQISIKMFGKKLENLTEEELKQIPMPSASGRGGRFYRQQAIDSSIAGIGSANRKYLDILKNLRGPFEEGSTDWVIPGVLKKELENIADMSQTERAKENQLQSLKGIYDKGIDLTVEGQRPVDKDLSFQDWVHKKGKGDLFFNEFQRGPNRREFLTHNLFNPVEEEPYKMEFPGRESIDFSAVPYAIGGRVGLKKGKRPYRLSRRGFLQWLAGITGATVAAGTGLIKLGKGAKTVAPKVTEEVVKRGVDGMPTYIDNLINVVQSKGIKKLVDSNINKMPDTVHTYKGVQVTQDAAGNTQIKKGKETFVSGSDEPGYREVEMEINRGGVGVKDEGLETQKTFQEPDEYFEGTVRPDMDGKMKDVDFHIDDADHLELKKIADEDLIKKAEGGLASYDTYLPTIDDVDY